MPLVSEKKSVNLKVDLPPLAEGAGYARLLSAWGGEIDACWPRCRCTTPRLLALMHVIDTARAAANDDTAVAQRERTVPIPSTITHVPGYPDKPCLYKMQASKYWQVRCWIAGRTYRRSTRTQNLRQALSFARTVYEEWLAENYQSASGAAGAGQARAPQAPRAATASFGTLAAQMFANEEGRVGRGEWTVGSLQVLRNRLDSYILPRWGAAPP